MLEPSALIDAVCGHDREQAAAALRAASGRGEELVPPLVARLESVVSNPAAWGGPDGAFTGFLFFLAAEFKALEAHAPMVAILRLDADRADQLLGDVLTEGCSAVLADTFAGDPTLLLGLVDDGGANPWARGAGLKALAKLWKRGRIERNDLFSWMLRLATMLDPQSGHDSIVANQLVETAVQIGAFEIRGTILGLYERELAEEFYFESDYAAAQLEPNAPPALEAKALDESIANAWERLKGWYFFAPERPQPAPSSAEPAPEPDDWAPPVPFRAPPKVGRNDPCPCGSGRKFKKCCGK